MLRLSDLSFVDEQTRRKVGVVGIGSIGSRYIEWPPEIGYPVGAFGYREGAAESLYSSAKVFEDLESCFDGSQNL